MDAYVTPSDRVVAVGQLYREVGRENPRTIRVVAIDGPYRDWKGIERCQVHYLVVVGVEQIPARSEVVDAGVLTDPALFELASAVTR